MLTVVLLKTCVKICPYCRSRYFVGDEIPEITDMDINRDIDIEGYKKCSNCGNLIYDFIERCPHCNTIEIIKKSEKTDNNQLQEDNLHINNSSKRKIPFKKVKFKRKKCKNCEQSLKCNVKYCLYCNCREFENTDECEKKIKINNHLLSDGKYDSKQLTTRKICAKCGRLIKYCKKMSLLFI